MGEYLPDGQIEQKLCGRLEYDPAEHDEQFEEFVTENVPNGHSRQFVWLFVMSVKYPP
jgi:hypothetical protein